MMVYCPLRIMEQPAAYKVTCVECDSRAEATARTKGSKKMLIEMEEKENKEKLKQNF
eukprot:c12864_g1_i1 orf=1318-1488(+)